MELSKPFQSGYQSRVWANTRLLLQWGIAWVASCALMASGPKKLWDNSLGLTLLAVGLNVAAGVGLMLAHKKYITELDELQQKVFLNALAITVGVAVIVGVPWSVMYRYHVIAVQANIANLIVLMSVTYVASVFYGNWRYR